MSEPLSVKQFPRSYEDSYQVNFGYGWLRLRRRWITAKRDEFDRVFIEFDAAMKRRLDGDSGWDRAELVGLRDLLDAVLRGDGVE